MSRIRSGTLNYGRKARMSRIHYNLIAKAIRNNRGDEEAIINAIADALVITNRFYCKEYFLMRCENGLPSQEQKDRINSWFEEFPVKTRRMQKWLQADLEEDFEE